MSEQPPKPILPTAADKSKKQLREISPTVRQAGVPSASRRHRLEINVTIGGKLDLPVKRLAVPSTEEPAAVLGRNEWDRETMSARVLNSNVSAEPVIQFREDIQVEKASRKTSLIFLSAVTFLVVLLTVGLFLWREQLPGNFKPMESSGLELEDNGLTDNSEYASMVKQAGELVQESTRILDRYAKATTYEQALAYVREPEKVKEKMARYWKPWPSARTFAEIPEGGLENPQNHPNIILTGRDGQQNPFTYRFVRENGKILLDWEASAGIADMSLEDAMNAAEGQEMALHVNVESSSFHPLAYPEESYRCYKVEAVEPGIFTWAFAPKESPVAHRLATLMGDDNQILEKAGKVQLTLKVSCLPGVGRKWLLIRDVLYEGWVRP